MFVSCIATPRSSARARARAGSRAAEDRQAQPPDRAGHAPAVAQQLLEASRSSRPARPCARPRSGPPGPPRQPEARARIGQRHHHRVHVRPAPRLSQRALRPASSSPSFSRAAIGRRRCRPRAAQTRTPRRSHGASRAAAGGCRSRSSPPPRASATRNGRMRSSTAHARLPRERRARSARARAHPARAGHAREHVEARPLDLTQRGVPAGHERRQRQLRTAVHAVAQRRRRPRRAARARAAATSQARSAAHAIQPTHAAARARCSASSRSAPDPPRGMYTARAPRPRATSCRCSTSCNAVHTRSDSATRRGVVRPNTHSTSSPTGLADSSQ